MRFPSDAEASGRRFGDSELNNLRRVLESGTLNCTRGTFVNDLEREFALRCGGEGWHCTAVSSGTAAIHCAVAALDSEPGDEIITTSITDMGALTPLLYQGAIPVFADIDPDSFNVTATTIAPLISSRTRAIIATHLFGLPCEMAPILELARAHNIPVIEDAAQAPFALYDRQRVGTLGGIGCFSLQQGKHMTCGEGGLVITRDAAWARRMRLFHDKAWGYGDERPDHYFLAPNYRMSELQGAVALAQLDRVEEIVRDRQRAAEQFLPLLDEMHGVTAQAVPAAAEAVWWKMTLRLDSEIIGADVREIGAYLTKNFGLANAPRYVQKPAFECAIFRDKKTFGNSQWPLRDVAPPAAAQFPGTYAALAQMLVLPWNENYEREHIEFLAHALRDALAHFAA